MAGPNIRVFRGFVNIDRGVLAAALAGFGVRAAIDAGAQILAGTEEGHGFRLHRHLLACARISPDAGLSFPHGEGTEAAKFDPVSVGEGFGNLVQNDSHDLLKVVLLEVTVFGGELGNEF